MLVGHHAPPPPETGLDEHPRLLLFYPCLLSGHVTAVDSPFLAVKEQMRPRDRSEPVHKSAGTTTKIRYLKRLKASSLKGTDGGTGLVVCPLHRWWAQAWAQEWIGNTTGCTPPESFASKTGSINHS